MSSNLVDARGRSCPEPVIMTKSALEQGLLPITVFVDNEVAKENVHRFASTKGYQVRVVEVVNDEYKLEITKG